MINPQKHYLITLVAPIRLLYKVLRSLPLKFKFFTGESYGRSLINPFSIRDFFISIDSGVLDFPQSEQ